MKIWICDDEKIFLDKIHQEVVGILEELDIGFSVNLYQTGEGVLEAFVKNPDVDIIFMDILLGNANGYEIASKIRERNSKVKIIFLTSITKYALKGYEIGASRYLVKPVSLSKLKQVLVNTINEVRKNNTEYIIEKNDNGVYKIFMNDIMYIETSGRNTIIHVNNQEILSYRTMKKHLIRLNEMFVRCHSGIIVNANSARTVRLF